MQSEISDLERAAIYRISRKLEKGQRDLLEAQLKTVSVSGRTDKTGGGYYVDFSSESAPALDYLSRSPLELDVLAPDGKNRLYFHLYLKDGLMSYMELSSTGEWPEDESKITFDLP